MNQVLQTTGASNKSAKCNQSTPQLSVWWCMGCSCSVVHQFYFLACIIWLGACHTGKLMAWWCINWLVSLFLDCQRLCFSRPFQICPPWAPNTAILWPRHTHTCMFLVVLVTLRAIIILVLVDPCKMISDAPGFWMCQRKTNSCACSGVLVCHYCRCAWKLDAVVTYFLPSLTQWHWLLN